MIFILSQKDLTSVILQKKLHRLKEPETEFQEWLVELFTKLHNLTENNFIPKSHYLEYGFQKMGKNFSYPVSEKFTTSDNDENLLGEDISNDLSE